jgi:hypothetical protein
MKRTLFALEIELDLVIVAGVALNRTCVPALQSVSGRDGLKDIFFGSVNRDPMGVGCHVLLPSAQLELTLERCLNLGVSKSLNFTLPRQ